MAFPVNINHANFLTTLLECPICLEMMEPPIYVCYTGHALCQDCERRIDECPTCKSTLVGTRNFSLESVAEQILYPCRFPNCEDMMKLSDRDGHEEECVHRTVRCQKSDCDWSGPVNQFAQHIDSGGHLIVKVPDRGVNPGPTQFELTVPGIDEFTHTYLVAFGELFKCTLSNYDDGLYMCVKHFGALSKTKTFEHILKLRTAERPFAARDRESTASAPKEMQYSFPVHHDLEDEREVCIQLPTQDWLETNGFVSDQEQVNIYLTIKERRSNKRKRTAGGPSTSGVDE